MYLASFSTKKRKFASFFCKKTCGMNDVYSLSILVSHCSGRFQAKIWDVEFFGVMKRCARHLVKETNCIYTFGTLMCHYKSNKISIENLQFFFVHGQMCFPVGMGMVCTHLVYIHHSTVSVRFPTRKLKGKLLCLLES